MKNTVQSAVFHYYSFPLKSYRTTYLSYLFYIGLYLRINKYEELWPLYNDSLMKSYWDPSLKRNIYLGRLNIDTRIQMRLTRWQLATTSGLRVRNLNWYQHTKMKINYCPKWLNDMHINQTQLPMIGQNEAELMNDNWTLQYKITINYRDCINIGNNICNSKFDLMESINKLL